VQVTHFAAGAYATTGGQDSCQRTVNSTAKTQHGLHTNLPTKNYRDSIYTLGAPLTWCLSTNQKPNLKHQGDGLGKISSNQPESYNVSFGRLDAYTTAWMLTITHTSYRQLPGMYQPPSNHKMSNGNLLK